MTYALADLKPATVLCVRNPDSIAGKAISIGEDLLGLPDSTHIALVHHTDDKGTVWALEARPGGVGWRDARAYIASPYTVANIGQPVFDASRVHIATEAEAMVGTDYAWLSGIAADAARDLHLEDRWGEQWGSHGVAPAHIVCSSYVAYLYTHYGQTAPMPSDPEHTEPGDWTKMILDHGWEALAS